MSAERRADSTLAYEHSVTVELNKAALLGRAQELQTACNSDQKFGCTVLDISTGNSEDVPNATIRVRLAPGGVDEFVGMASRGGTVIRRNTHAEDLAEPVADTERQLAQLTEHRARLEGFMKDKSLKIDQVIAVSRELAEVQTRFDALSAQHANLRRRIDTELLAIDFTLPTKEYHAEMHPIRDAFRSFGGEFTDAIAQMIGFVAALLPWLVIILPGLILIRMFWRWVGRWLVRREQR